LWLYTLISLMNFSKAGIKAEGGYGLIILFRAGFGKL
jgi:hypothetical protein